MLVVDVAAVSILSLHIFALCGGSKGRRLLFSDTIKIYEDLLVNPGELVRLQGPVGCIGSCGELWFPFCCKSCVNSSKTRASLTQI